ncbi:hypothetical protein MKZ38_009640 [Zalerion maritima]|uniref:Mitochondrial thiamine pyrophosphate carrier 1 n=1 Tax=Zalerion maritima TaxID=339359 RepID=A0AAD5WTE0_9PEZI|nr:hypothetical protein MKZ38_009640 [Zalerion maritima]
MPGQASRLEGVAVAQQASVHTHRKKKTPEPALCPTDDDAVIPRRKQKNRQSWDYIWRSGVAGGLAGCAAKTLVAPLDRVKILFQAGSPQFIRYQNSWFGTGAAMRDIYLNEGAIGLFKGHSATLIRIFPYAGIKFLAYEQIRGLVISRKDHETPFRRLISGSLAGVTSVFFTYPLEVIRVRMAFETKAHGHSNLAAICRQIYRENPTAATVAPRTHNSSGGSSAYSAVRRFTTNTANALTPAGGTGNFYRGFSSTLLGMLPYAGMSFLTHDTAGDLLRLPAVAKYTTLKPGVNHPLGKPAPLRSWAELCAGGVAGLVSQTVSYPLEVIRRRMQVGGAVGDGRRLKIAETAKTIFQERGFRGFWVGLTIGYIKVVPMVAVSFYTYERLKLALGI